MSLPFGWNQVTETTDTKISNTYYWNEQLYCAVDTIQEVYDIENKKHPSLWNHKTHYGQCGQSCPCCRKKMGEILGTCPICDTLPIYQNLQKKVMFTHDNQSYSFIYNKYNLRPRRKR